MLPLSAQALYFQLGMNADDDGYVEHFAVTRMISGKQDDLKLLESSLFVEIFNDHVLIILDWDKQNKIQPTRKIDSIYINIFKPSTKCQQNVNKMSTQVRLGKGSIGKVRIDKKKKFDIDKFELPQEINKKAWSELVQHRKDIKKPIKTELAASKLINKLKADIPNHVHMIDNSIAGGYQGLFPVNGNGVKKQPSNILKAKEDKYAKYD
jgi:hypothetical protein